MATRTAFDSFLILIKQFRDLAVGGLLVGGGAPFVSWMVGISPPWPPGVEPITAAIELVAVILVFHALYEKGRRARATRILAWSAGGFLILLVTYLLMHSLFVYSAPDGERFVRGFACLPYVAETWPGMCPLDLPQHVIQGAAWEASLLWTASSIALARGVLAIVWLAMFLGLAALIGSFIVYQTGRRARPIDMEA